MTARAGLRTVLGALLASLAAACCLAATARADVDVRTDFGHGGSWIADAATPLDVLLRNTDARPVQVALVVHVDGYGTDDSFVLERTVALGPNGVRREGFIVPGPTSWNPKVTVRIETNPGVPVRSVAKTGDRGRLELEVVGIQRQGGSVQAEQTRPVGVLFDPRSVLAARLNDLDLDARERGQRNELHLRTLALDDESLRLAPHALDGLATIVVCDPDESFCQDAARLDGLLDWVAMGGRLVVSLGENAQRFATSPLAAQMPARWTGVGRAGYVREAEDLGARDEDLEGRRDGPRVRLAAADGTTSPERSGDLLVERAFGDGTIAVLGCDVRVLFEFVPPDTPSARTLARRIVGAGSEFRWPAERTGGWVQEFDVATRIGRVLQQEAFTPPPLAAVLLGLFAYVLVVGPLDWIVLRRMRKERLTTLTFTGAVLAFTVLAYGVSLFLFSAKEVANRVTFVRLSSGGRDGRELIRVHDLVGWYAPTGGTRDLTYPLPGPVLGSNLPGLHSAGGVGAALPIVVTGNDPLNPRTEVEVAFRSQRVVHASLVGTTGRTLSLARDAGRYEVRNTLPVDLTECWVFLPGGSFVPVASVPAGGTGTGNDVREARSLGWESESAQLDGSGGRETPEDDAKSVRHFLAHVVASALTSEVPPAAHTALFRAGIVCDPPRDGRALIVGVTDRLPVELPGADARGRRHVVIVKEVELE